MCFYTILLATFLVSSFLHGKENGEWLSHCRPISVTDKCRVHAVKKLGTVEGGEVILVTYRGKDLTDAPPSPNPSERDLDLGYGVFYRPVGSQSAGLVRYLENAWDQGVGASVPKLVKSKSGSLLWFNTFSGQTNMTDYFAWKKGKWEKLEQNRWPTDQPEEEMKRP